MRPYDFDDEPEDEPEDDFDLVDYVECPVCSGRGTVGNNRKCEACDGSGVICV